MSMLTELVQASAVAASGSGGGVVKLDSIIFEVDNHFQFLMVWLSLEQRNSISFG